MAEEEEERRRAGTFVKSEEDTVSDSDTADLRDIILDLINDNVQGLDKVGAFLPQGRCSPSH
jgi:hypothetical protein